MTYPAGTVVAGYTIERLLGAGGMGTVYLARHPSLPRSDALKILSAELSADAEFQARFRREAELAAALDHPNIVRVYTRGETAEGQLWIAMQFVDGTDAAAVLRQGPMSTERSMHILAEVAAALDHAHAAGTLHRDIKPANFLLTDTGGHAERVLLADFGIARALNETSRLTAAGSMVSTVAYTAPEAIDDQAVDHRSDLYGLGCSLYRMLVGRTPYQDANGLAETMLAHLMTPVPPATDHAPWLPTAINDVFATALAKKPEDRFASAAELVAAAETALAATTPGATSPPAPPSSPPPGPPAAPPPTPAPPPAGGLEPRPASPSSPAGTPGARRRRWLVGAAGAAVVAVVVAAVTIWPGISDDAPYAPQTFSHTFGATELAARPSAVATVGVADTDVALSLGVRPVGFAVADGTAPSWLSAMVVGRPVVVPEADAADLGSAHPDLIIDTDPTGRAGYEKLAAVAPTITRPTGTNTPWSPEELLSWLAQILGEQSKADVLQKRAAADAEAIRTQYPDLVGVAVSVFTFSDSGVSAELSNSPAASYLSSLGMQYNPKLVADSAATTRPVEAEALSALAADLTVDLTVVMRTDKAAKAGGYAGLPSPFLYGSSIVVVIDDPDTITALSSAGPAATRYLNSIVVPELAGKLGA